MAHGLTTAGKPHGAAGRWSRRRSRGRVHVSGSLHRARRAGADQPHDNSRQDAEKACRVSGCAPGITVVDTEFRGGSCSPSEPGRSGRGCVGALRLYGVQEGRRRRRAQPHQATSARRGGASARRARTCGLRLCTHCAQARAHGSLSTAACGFRHGHGSGRHQREPCWWQATPVPQARLIVSRLENFTVLRYIACENGACENGASGNGSLRMRL